MVEKWLPSVVQKVSDIIFDPLVLNALTIFGTVLGVLKFLGKTLCINKHDELKNIKKSRFNRFETTISVLVAICFVFFVAASYHYRNKSNAAMFASNRFYEVPPGWGPERNTYRIETPSVYPSLNSFVNNPAHGDERNFVQIKKKSESAEKYCDSINIERNTTYTVFVYFSNSSTAHNDLLNTKINIILPSCVPQRGSNGLQVKLRSNTSIPSTVWDGCELVNNSSSTLEVMYVDKSAVIHTAGKLDGKQLNSAELLTSGTLLGINQFDGIIKGESHPRNTQGYVSFDIYVSEPKSMFTSWKSKTPYSHDMSDEDVSTLVIRYINTNSTPDKVDFSIHNLISSGIKLKNISYCNEYTSYERRQLRYSNTSINIGTYLPGEVCYMFFDYSPVRNKAEIDSEDTCRIHFNTSNIDKDFETILE